MLLPDGAALGAIELRAGPASSQIAIETAVRAAHFGYYASGHLDSDTPLPEPGRIKAEPARAARGRRTVTPVRHDGLTPRHEDAR